MIRLAALLALCSCSSSLHPDGRVVDLVLEGLNRPPCTTSAEANNARRHLAAIHTLELRDPDLLINGEPYGIASCGTIGQSTFVGIVLDRDVVARLIDESRIDGPVSHFMTVTVTGADGCASSVLQEFR